MFSLQQLLRVGLLLAMALPASAEIIVQYTAPSGSFVPTTTATHATASSLNETGSAGDLQPGATFPNTVFLQQNITSTTPADAVANSQYFQFSAGADPGYLINLTDLTFNAARGGASTPRGWVLRSSVDGFGSTLAAADIPTTQPNLTPYSIDLSGSAFQNLGSDVTLRLYGYAPTTGVGLFFDDITLNGSVAAANTLVQYDAPGGSFAPTSVGSHITADPLNETGSGADLQPGATFPNTVFLQQNITSTTPAAAVSNSQYFAFALRPDAGYRMDLLGLNFDVARGGASTPRGWVLRSSLDGFGSDIASADVPTTQPTLTPFDVDLSALAYQDLESEVTFRLYGYAPSTGVGLFYDNLRVAGNVELVPVGTVPEPASLLLAALGSVGFVRFRRRSRVAPH